MLQKLNLIMNQTLPATYDDSLSYYEALSKICYEVNEIIDRINADEALIAANSEAITSINSQIASINNSLEADAEKSNSTQHKLTVYCKPCSSWQHRLMTLERE